MSEQEQAPTTEQAPERSLSLLASQKFGAQFHGEVKEPEVPNEQEATEEARQEAEQLPEQENEAEEVEAAEAETPSDEETEEVPISSFDELVEHNEWDPEWAKQLRVQAKVDGETRAVPLSDLVKSYQLTEAAEKRLEEAKTKAKSLNQELAEQKQAIEQQYATAAELIKHAEKMLDTDSKGINWSELRENDPAEYSAKKTEMAERRQRLEEMKRDASSKWREQMEKAQQEAQAQHQERLKAEHEALIEKVPEWRDEEKAKVEKGELAKYLMSQGFSEQDVASAADHRLILMARKAMLFDKRSTESKAALKKVAKIPKVMKPGTPKPKEQQTREQQEKARQRLRKSGSVDDAFALLKARRSTGA